MFLKYLIYYVKKVIKTLKIFLLGSKTLENNHETPKVVTKATLPVNQTSLPTFSTIGAKTTIQPTTKITFSKAMTIKPTKILAPSKDKSENKTLEEKFSRVQDDSKSFSMLCHAYHNFYRRKHGSPDIQLDNQLNSEAQKYTIQCLYFIFWLSIILFSLKCKL